MFGLEFLSKENLALIGVSILFVWRIVDMFIRLNRRREHELRRLAFDMAKVKMESDKEVYQFEGKPILSYYTYCLSMLKKGIYNPHKLLVWNEKNEAKVIKKIDEFEIYSKRLDEKWANIENKIESKIDIDLNDLYEKNISWRNVFKDIKYLFKKPFLKLKKGNQKAR